MNLFYVFLIIIIIEAVLNFISSTNKKKKEVEPKLKPVYVNDNYQETERENAVILNDNITATDRKYESTKDKSRPLSSDDTKSENGYMHKEQEDTSVLGFDADVLVKAVLYSEILSPPKAYRRGRRGVR